jgi:glycine cleavage system transcriptional repressor
LGLYAVTMVGTDRPGVVAEVMRALAERGAIGDSSMIPLSGYLAMTLVISSDLAAGVLGEGLSRRFPGAADVASLMRRTASALVDCRIAFRPAEPAVM